MEGALAASERADAAARRAADAPLEASTSGQEGDDLWVQKYAPHAFLELLSDEQINREAVRWLKLWDPFVFGGPAKGGGRKGGKATPLQLPEHRILLLCGPPGQHPFTWLLSHSAWPPLLCSDEELQVLPIG